MCFIRGGLANCVTWVGIKLDVLCTPSNKGGELEKNVYTLFRSAENRVLADCGGRAPDGVQLLDSDLTLAGAGPENGGYTYTFLSPYSRSPSQEIRCICNPNLTKSGPLWTDHIRDAEKRISIFGQCVTRGTYDGGNSLADHGGGFFGDGTDRVNFLYLWRASLMIYFNVFYRN